MTKSERDVLLDRLVEIRTAMLRSHGGKEGLTEAERRDYYVSLIRDKRVALLAGPFATHTDALATVDAAREAAYAVDSRTWFDLIGTSSLPYLSTNPCGKLNQQIGVIARPPSESAS